jgi:hypothetical protein
MLGARKAIVVLLTLGVATGGCFQSTPKDALRLSSESLEQRRLQTRYFDTSDEIRLLTAVTAVLQDLGFTIDDSEADLGLVVASKQRDASEVGQIVVAIFVAALTGAWMPTDDEQLMRASVVTRPIGDTGKRTAVRVTFQRIVWDTEGKVTHAESLADPAFYQEFFARLSKAIFLQAHAI